MMMGTKGRHPAGQSAMPRHDQDPQHLAPPPPPPWCVMTIGRSAPRPPPLTTCCAMLAYRRVCTAAGQLGGGGIPGLQRPRCVPRTPGGGLGGGREGGWGWG